MNVYLKFVVSQSAFPPELKLDRACVQHYLVASSFVFFVSRSIRAEMGPTWLKNRHIIPFSIVIQYLEEVLALTWAAKAKTPAAVNVLVKRLTLICGKFRDRLLISVVIFIFLDSLFVMALQPCLIWRISAIVPQGEYSAGVRGAQGAWARWL